jgi:hypothetical protein
MVNVHTEFGGLFIPGRAEPRSSLQNATDALAIIATAELSVKNNGAAIAIDCRWVT